MKRGIAAAGLLFVLLASVLPIPALAAVPNRPENQYVLDKAGVLSFSDTEREIISENQKLFRETGAEIVVVAVDFLDGKAADDYAYDLFNDWGIGSKERNNGLLLVFAVGQNKCYALPGSGIDGYFTGAKLEAMLEDYFYDDYDAGRYDSAVQKFFRAALAELKNYSYNDKYNQGFVWDETDVGKGRAASNISVGQIVYQIILAGGALAILVIILRAIWKAADRDWETIKQWVKTAVKWTFKILFLVLGIRFFAQASAVSEDGPFLTILSILLLLFCIWAARLGRGSRGQGDSITGSASHPVSHSNIASIPHHEDSETSSSTSFESSSYHSSSSSSSSSYRSSSSFSHGGGSTSHGGGSSGGFHRGGSASRGGFSSGGRSRGGGAGRR